MMKQILVGCALLGLLTVGSLPAYAQTPAPAPTTPTATQNISPDELKKFASAIKQMLAIAQETDTKMAQAVQQSGLSEARFREIYVSKKDPAAKPKEPVSPKEEESYNQTIAKLTQLQKDAKAKMDKSIVAEGLAVDRFNQIFGAVQKDPKLQQEVRDMIKK